MGNSIERAGVAQKCHSSSMGFTISGFTEEKLRDLMNGLRSRDSRGNCDNLSAEMLEMIGVLSECDPGVRSGWEAGIRTPITCSRGTRPTVGRPPNSGLR